MVFNSLIDACVRACDLQGAGEAQKTHLSCDVTAREVCRQFFLGCPSIFTDCGEFVSAGMEGSTGDDCYECPSGFDYVRCSDCNLLSTEVRPTVLFRSQENHVRKVIYVPLKSL